MIRRMVVALDGSPSSNAAAAVALRLASKTKAPVIGLGVVDAEWLHRPDAMPVGVLSYRHALDLKAMRSVELRMKAVMNDFVTRARQAGVEHMTVTAKGDAREAIDSVAHSCDLIVLGKTSLHSAKGEFTNVSLAVEHELRTCMRPVLVVPDLQRVAEPGRERLPILAAFDGSAVSSRTLHMFALLGLGRGRQVHVLTQDDRSPTKAAATAERGAEFLRLHGQRQARAVGLGDNQAGKPAEAILGAARSLDAGMIAMGAYGQRGIREIFGSCTRSVLDDMETPLFVYH